MAEARAMELLYENLSTEQRDMLRSLGYFEVIGGETGRMYRIRSAYRMNVEEISARGTRMCLMCFCPNGRVGLGDIMLAQKLALELFELDALAIANIAPYEFEVLRRLDNRCRTALRGRS